MESAVAIKYLQHFGDERTPLGKDVYSTSSFDLHFGWVVNYRKFNVKSAYHHVIWAQSWVKKNTKFPYVDYFFQI